MPDQSEFYQQHLDRVSRSFAFCIRQLPMPLREWVGLSYLLCRTLDTIEDALWASESDQLKAFAAFDGALRRPESVRELSEMSMPQGVPAFELELMKDSSQLFDDLHNLKGGTREIMIESIGVMSAGMQTFCKRRKGGPLQLHSMADVNQYCFFVAGVVGELLARLLAKVEPKFSVSPMNLLRAHHFGLFLQKVNLLKDQVRDEREGRHLIPSREQVEGSSAENARWALEFLLDIPQEQMEFRRFCAWSLFLGLEALNAARRSVREQRVIKVARKRTDQILEEVENHLPDNLALKNMFAEFTDQLGWSAVVEETPRSLSQLGVNS